MAVKDFAKILREIDPSKDNYTKFRDFLTLAYCAYAKRTAAPAKADALEEEYMRVVGQYRNKDDIRRMPELIAMTIAQAGQNTDFLGSVAGELETLNADAGQYFTPYEVCRLMAELNFGGIDQIIEEKGFVTVHEPACGAGAMLLAITDLFEWKGYDPTTQLWIEAINVAEMPFKMCFLQLAFRGVSGRIWRGNSLSMEMQEMAVLPGASLFLDKNGDPFPAEETPAENAPSKDAAQFPQMPAEPFILPPPTGEQMDLF